MKRLIVSIAMLAFAAIATGEERPEIVATINGEVLTKKDFDKMWNGLTPEMQKSYEAAGGKIQFLDNHIRKRLVIQEALKEGFTERDDVKFTIDRAVENAIFDAYVRLIMAKQVISESDIRALYEERKDKLILKERVNARHIIATPDSMAVNNRANSNAMSEAEAEEKMINLRRQLESNPESFADLALQFSEDGAALSGGSLGWFPKGKMVEEFDEVAFSLEPGEISDVFKTRYGYHIVKVEEVAPAGPAPYEDVREKLLDEILRERTSEVMARVQSFTQELRSASNISVNRENL